MLCVSLLKKIENTGFFGGNQGPKFMSQLQFKKMHGLGNDFVILDGRQGAKLPDQNTIKKLCDRHFGVGCDQLVTLENSACADIGARFYNADGSESSACGNATRCVARLVMAESGENSCRIETQGGILPCRARPGDLIEVDMGPPKLSWRDIPLSHSMDTLHLEIGEGLIKDPVAVGMGNPHCVFFVDRLEDIDVEKLGKIYEHHECFPQRTNVEFAQILTATKLRQVTWERGVGLTLACGSGACAVAVAAMRRGLTAGRALEIVLDGGTLHIEWLEKDDHVLMTGPAVYVFDGIIKE